MRKTRARMLRVGAAPFAGKVGGGSAPTPKLLPAHHFLKTEHVVVVIIAVKILVVVIVAVVAVL